MRELAQLPTPAIAKRILLIVRCSCRGEDQLRDGRDGLVMRDARQLVGSAEVVGQGLCARVSASACRRTDVAAPRRPSCAGAPRSSWLPSRWLADTSRAGPAPR